VNTKAALLIAVCASGTLAAHADQPVEPQPPPVHVQTSSPAFTNDNAVVEEVVSTVDDGYRFRAYVVRWHGARVLVSDLPAESNGAVGDTIHFMVARHDVEGVRLLSFIGIDLDPARRRKTAQKDAPDSSIKSEPGTATIEEVLHTEDDGYRFIAYLASWNGSRIAISDPLASSHGGIGGPVSFMAVHAGANGKHVLAFESTEQSNPTGSVRAQRAPATASPETGIVDEVLTAEADGYLYHAYVVQWNGSRIVVTDEDAPTQYQAGDGVTFLSRHQAMPGQTDAGLLSFAWSTTTDSNPTPPFAGRIATTTDTAIVEEVLTSQVESNRFVAYIVKWHGARVAISDMFATTHYAAGDRIEFPVSRVDASHRQQLRFMIFSFPGLRPKPTVPAAARNDPSPTPF
jgi:hypothetical protein